MVGRLNLRSSNQSHNLVQGQPAKGQVVTKGQVATGDPVANHTNDLLSRLTPATDVGKGKHLKAQDCKAVNATCRGCGKKGTLQKGLPARQTLCTLSGDLTDNFGRRWGPVHPYISMMRGQPVYTYMVRCPPCKQTLD